MESLNDAIKLYVTGNIQDDGQDGCQNIQIFEKDKSCISLYDTLFSLIYSDQLLLKKKKNLNVNAT